MYCIVLCVADLLTKGTSERIKGPPLFSLVFRVQVFQRGEGWREGEGERISVDPFLFN